jgi:hypothetical protein
MNDESGMLGTDTGTTATPATITLTHVWDRAVYLREQNFIWAYLMLKALDVEQDEHGANQAEKDALLDHLADMAGWTDERAEALTWDDYTASRENGP